MRTEDDAIVAEFLERQGIISGAGRRGRFGSRSRG